MPWADVANAVGAAIAKVSGEVDQVFSGTGREGALDIPLAYLPGDALRVRVRMVGDAARRGAGPEPS